jgi:hypothetical protein
MLRPEAAARALGKTYSGRLPATARKEFTIRAGLDAVAQFEHQRGAFSSNELGEAEKWAAEAVERAKRSGARRRRTA